jgi:hypothetical protein
MNYILVMSIETIIAQINAEIAQLQQARALLGSSGSIGQSIVVGTGKKRGPKPGSKRGPKPGVKTGKKRRVLSPEARQRIADAQHRRWAAQKAAVKKGKKSS